MLLCRAMLSKADPLYEPPQSDSSAAWFVQSILEQADIHPSNTDSYPLTKLKHAIKTAVGTFPDVQCTGANINEVHFCLQKDLKVRRRQTCGLRSPFLDLRLKRPRYLESVGAERSFRDSAAARPGD